MNSVSAAPVNRVLSADALEYRDEYLGRWSSHPHWLERGSKLLRRTVVLTLVVAYLVVFYAWLRGHALGDVLRAVVDWPAGAGGRTGAALIAFSLGMLAASAFQLRWAMRQHDDAKLDPDSDRNVTTFSMPVVLAVVFVGFVLPLVLTFAPGLPAELRVLGPLLAFLPVAVLSYLLPSQRDPRSRFPWLTLLVLVVAWVLALLPGVVEWIYANIPASLKSFFPAINTPQGLRTTFFALAGSVTILALFRIVITYRDRHAHSAEDSTTEEQRTEPPSATDGSDVWLNELASALGMPAPTVQTLMPNPEETVDWEEQSEFETFFDGKHPTRDQHKILKDFSHLLVSSESANAEGDATSGFEMVLEGPSGSGRSTVLDALSLLSVIGYGAHVVVFVPDEGRIGIAVDRIQRKIVRLNVGEFVVAGSLESACLAADAEQTPPEICVTTPEQWEERLPGSLNREGDRYENIRALMCRYSTVLVDDWLDHPLPIRLHLPFIVDKHRLLLESEMIPSVRVYAFPRLTDAGHMLAVDRLIGHGGIRDESRQIGWLHYRRDLTARVLDFDVEGVGETVDRIALELCKAGRSSVLMRMGIDAEEAARQTEDFRSRSQSTNITVCYCYDQLDALVGDLSSIVMKAADGPDAVFALRARRNEDGIAVIRVRNTREIPASVQVTPLIVERSGRGIAEAHLRNILRFITERTPVAQRAWGQLGSAGKVGDAPAKARDVGQLLLDRPEDVSEAMRRDRPYLSKLGSFMALSEPFKRLDAVDCHWIPESGQTWWNDGGDAVFGPQALCIPEPLEKPTSFNTTALWKGNDGAPLGRTQLQYAADLLLRGRQIFCPEVMRADRAGGIEILAARFRDNGRDAIHPKIELSWRMVNPAGADNKADLPDSASGGPDHGYLWVDSGSADGFEIAARLIERTDDLDRPTPCSEFEFRYRSSLRALLVAPSAAVIDKHREFQDALKELFSADVEWGTDHPDFLPGVTYAFTRGIELDLPSSAFLCRILAFRLSGRLGEFAESIVWFVEPQGTGTTLSNAVHELLRGDGFLGALSFRMDRILAQGWDKSPPGDLARFWLPRKLRKSITLFERRLIATLAGHDDEVHATATIQPTVWRATCPHCQQVFEVQVNPSAGTTFVQHCDRTVAMIVPTDGGALSTPRDLITPWWPPDAATPKGSETEWAMAVWAMVAKRLEYTRDTQPRERLTDCWVSPSEVWARRKGDCEDHSILIVAMLRSLGIKCWLTWGMTEKEGHAWVEADLDSKHVIIEATMKLPLPSEAIPASDVGELSAVYGAEYHAGALYSYQEGLPSRTDGETYDSYKDGQWSSVLMAEPVPLPTAVKPSISESGNSNIN